MATRRQVNVNRPEHSWIPFYQELAEKLVSDGWRDRQKELVGILQRLRSAGVPIHGIVDNLSDHIDPFTFYALFSRELRLESISNICESLRTEFGISAQPQKEMPFIPYADHRGVGYFYGFDDINEDIETLWDVFEGVLDVNGIEDLSVGGQIDELIRRGLDVRGVGISKLTSAMYWINPVHFLHSDTVNAIGGQDLSIEAKDAETYLRALIRTSELTTQSFPEVNISVFKEQNPDWDPPKVWIVRGGRNAAAVEEFLTAGFTGFGFAFGDIDVSRFQTVDQLERFCEERGLNKDGIDQIIRFLTEIKINDYVLMPGPGSAANYYGRVKSDPYHDQSGTHRNRRDVSWFPKMISRAQLDLSSYRYTVTRPIRDVQDKFMAIIKDDDISFDELKMPEDSWVPFHLEVGKKLIEGEWWSQHRRDDLERRIRLAVASTPNLSSSDVDERWSPDPFSLYLAFNLRTSPAVNRIPAYEVVKELFEIDAEVPSEHHEATGYGVMGRFGNRLGTTEIESLWEFFRLAHGEDPIDDPDVAPLFVELFDQLIEPEYCSGLRGPKVSYWLYWIDPTRYIYAEQLQKLGILNDLGLRKDAIDGKGYVGALAAARQLAAKCDRPLLDLNRWGTTRDSLGIGQSNGGTATRTTDTVGFAPYSINGMLDDGVFFERDVLERILDRFRDKQNLILQGPPGVGKTFVSRRFAYALMGERADDRVVNVQFHQSYSYEEFVRGYRPDTNEDRQLIFESKDGAFLKLCERAREDKGKKYVMIIDEINRGNLSRVFGELLSLVENDKRGDEFKVTLAGGEEFSVPENVYILGTMNLADRSLAGMDYAMRRRFAFVTLEPQFGEKGDEFKKWLRRREVPEGMITRIDDRMSALNEVIAGDASLGRNFAVGHSYFCDIADGDEGDWEGWYREIVETEIRPLLEEYWFDDLKKADEEVEPLLDGIE